MLHHLLSNIFIFIGSLFILIAAIGLIRFDDIYMKMHAATKAGALGAGFVLLGVGLDLENIHAITEVILLIFFIMLTNPISTHIIAKSYYRSSDKDTKKS